MSSYSSWYKNAQEEFKNELATMAVAQIFIQENYIRTKAARLGLLKYCKNYGYLPDATVESFNAEPSIKVIEVKKPNFLKRIINWFAGVFDRA